METAGYYSNLRGNTAYSRGVPTGQTAEGVDAKAVVVGTTDGVGRRQCNWIRSTRRWLGWTYHGLRMGR